MMPLKRTRWSLIDEKCIERAYEIDQTSRTGVSELANVWIWMANSCINIALNKPLGTVYESPIGRPS